MTGSDVRATVDGKFLFEGGLQAPLVSRAVSLFLVTRPEDTANVTSSVNRVDFIARSFTQESGPSAHARPGKAAKRIMRRW